MGLIVAVDTGGTFTDVVVAAKRELARALTVARERGIDIESIR